MVEFYDEKLPRHEDFEDKEVYYEALEGFFDELDTSKPLSVKIYKAYRDYNSHLHFITSEKFEIDGSCYLAVLLLSEDGEGLDDMNTVILLVAYGGS